MLSPACCRCRWRVSVETYLVNMSAGLSFVWILMSLTQSCEISCCMNKCLSSMCFAFLEDPILAAILLPLDESVWILMLILLILRSSIKRLLMWSASVAPVLMAYSSASALESAIVACVLLP